MNDWNDTKARRDATTEFVKRLNANPALREVCKKDQVAAKAVFLDAGKFTSIPDTVQFFVMEANRAASDGIVALVLPDVTVDPDTVDPVNVWKCTWPIYAS